MREGIIDIGTNTFHLLIVDRAADNEVLHKEKVAVRIGKNGISKGFISDDAVERAIETLTRFRAKIKEYEVEKVTATATSAVRNAENKQEFVDAIRETTGIEINILSGHDEAFLIYQGVKEFLTIEDPALIMDIGGGSIEFILADGDHIIWLRSYEIGGQRLIDQFHKSDPIATNEINDLNQFLNETLTEVFEKCEQYGAQYLIGSSGSFDTFWDMYSAKVNASINESPILTQDSFQEIYDDLISKNKEERLVIPGMVRMRVDMIVGAAVVTKNVMDNCGFSQIKVSPFALKEGVLFHGLPKSN
ncbi:Ppx/GppA phosphatase family protein [Reichenbachiella ulvae]|uniref:Phosphatase n=1 Tax=Reichenbachiella ulvae TaxID=2980104 RepID=A0ABT3D041_9BACT|nr:phosphatase [Reichenbachiella ulvae]MCV9389316.1 phosphatase [Reichenbachiella ulvae]